MSDSRTRPPSGSPAPLSTLAALVRHLAPGTSWEQARALCRAGRVWVDGCLAADPSSRPDAAARVELLSAVAARSRADAGEVGEGSPDLRPAPFLVYADADLAVVRKPPGILTVPFERGDRDTLLALTRVALRRLETRQGPHPRPPGARSNPTLRAVQRLDRDTSGLVVFARQVAAQRHLQQQLADGDLTRRYDALAHGTVRDATLATWLVDDRGDGLRGSWGTFRTGPVSPRPSPRRATSTAPEPPPRLPPPGARHAVTHVHVLEPLRGATRLACELETGRQHQIRIHLAEAGHPLLGEAVYIRDFRGPRIPAPRPMLHAAALAFLHPRDGRPLLFEEPPPPDFMALLVRLRLPTPRRRNPGRS